MLSARLLRLVSLLPPADSEQEVPCGTTEAVQSVDYYCDSKSIPPLAAPERGFAVLRPLGHAQQQLLQGVL